MGRCVGADPRFSWWRTAPPDDKPDETEKAVRMTLNDLAEAFPGPVSAEADAPGGDTYETSRTFESLGVSHELIKALAD